MKWRPIRTAPKDGTSILASDFETTDVTEFDGYQSWMLPRGRWNPKIWLPIPALPKRTAQHE